MSKKSISRRTAVSAMALSAGLVVADRVLAVDRPPFLVQAKLDAHGKETLEEMFWQNALSERFLVEGYSWLESSERSEPATLVLHSVSRYSPESKDLARPKKIRPNAILLQFRGRKGLELESASYQLSHRSLGQYELMLSKTQNESGLVLYEAVLN